MKAALAFLPAAAVVVAFAVRRRLQDRQADLDFAARVRTALHSGEEPDPAEMARLERQERVRVAMWTLLNGSDPSFWGFAERQFGEQPRTLRRPE